MCATRAFAVGGPTYHLPGMLQIGSLVRADLAELDQREVEWLEYGCGRKSRHKHYSSKSQGSCKV